MHLFPARARHSELCILVEYTQVDGTASPLTRAKLPRSRSYRQLWYLLVPFAFLYTYTATISWFLFIDTKKIETLSLLYTLHAPHHSTTNTLSSPSLAPGTLPPPLAFSRNVFARHKALFLLFLVVFGRTHHLLLFSIAQFVQVLRRHQVTIHPALQVVLTKVAALVMRVLVLLEAVQVKIHAGFAFGVVIERKDASLWRSHDLFGSAHARS